MNKKFPLFNELRSIIIKTTDQNSQVIQEIIKLGQVDLILLSGYFMQKDSEVDLFIVGEIDKKSLEEFLEKEVTSENPIRFTVMNREDFMYRVKCNDRFVKDLVTDPDNMIGYNQLQDTLV